MEKYKYRTTVPFMGSVLEMVETPANNKPVILFSSDNRVSKIAIRWNGKKEYFTFQYHPSYYEKAEIYDVIEHLFGDMAAYDEFADDDIAGFLKEFGYMEDKETRRTGMAVYRACRDNAQKIRRLFSDDEFDRLQDMINEV